MAWIRKIWRRIKEFFNNKQPEPDEGDVTNTPNPEPQPDPRVPDTPTPVGPSDELINKALDITGAFEGSGFNQVTGNFDGQGISAGVLQWNYGQGSLQSKILKPILSKYGRGAFDMFPNPSAVIDSAYMSASRGKSQAKRYMLTWGGKVKPEWESAWKS